MRRWWYVPFIGLLVVLLFRARPAGYTTATLPATTTASAVLALAPTSVTAESTATVAPSTPTAMETATAVAEVTVVPIASAVAATPTAEPPALAPEVAPPTTQETPAPAPPVAVAPAPDVTQRFPVRLRIPAIDLDLQPIAVGLDSNRVPVVPKHDAGWYAASAIPGGGSNVVFWGHVLRWLDSPNVAAPFARMQELQPGAPVEITLANGEQWLYRVTQQVQARPEDVQYILPTDGERITLVSCVGDKVIRNGVLTKEFRLITIAEPQ